MFTGHYGPAAAVAGKRVKLWHGFVAVQFLDILWAPFILLGVEKARIVEHFTASNHFDLYFMPYTHSLVMALVWSVVIGGAYHLWRKTGGAIIGALVFSHWILDYLMHKPDLELWFGGPKVGLGLWDHRLAAVGIELGFLLAGFALYFSRMRPKGAGGVIAACVLLILLIAAQLYGNFGPPPSSADEAAQTAIIAYAVFAAFAAMIDAMYVPRTR